MEISKKKLEQLNNLIVDFEFKSFEYEPGKEVITDQPSCITTVEYQDGKNKEVNHYHGDILINDNLTIFEKEDRKEFLALKSMLIQDYTYIR